MRRFNGFSLMEMMVVLTIVAIVAAVAAPMVNKKILATANEKSPWVFTGVGQNIAYDVNNNSHAIIGGVNPLDDAKLSLYNNGDITTPHIAFNGGARIFSNNSKLWFTPVNADENFADFNNIVAIGTGQTVSGANGAIAIGNRALSMEEGAIVIGTGSAVQNDHTKTANSIAIGNSINNRYNFSTMIGSNIAGVGGNVDESIIAISSNDGSRNIGSSSVVIGNRLEVNAGQQSVILGNQTRAADSATAIGTGAIASGNGSIAIGSAARQENWIPANLPFNAVYAAAAIKETSNSVSSFTNTSTNKEAKEPWDPGNGGGTNGGGINGILPPPLDAEINIQDQNFGVDILEVTLENRARALGESTIAIGQGATVNNSAANSVAIGRGATVNNATDSIAIGRGASATASNSVAIGQGAQANEANRIVLGRTAQAPTVVIPGDLIVQGTVTVAGNTTVGGTLGVTGATTLNNATVGGTLGVTGETTLNSALTVAGLSKFNMQYYDNSNTKDDVVLYYDNNIGGKPVVRFMKTSFSFSDISDRRLKNVGEAFTAGLEEIKKLEVFNYTFKKDESKTPRVGVMAQDLQKIFPQAVFKGEDGFLRIRMEDMFYALVNAVKQLDAKIEELKKNEILTLKNRMDDLEKANKELRKENEALEKRLDKLEKKLDKKLKD